MNSQPQMTNESKPYQVSFVNRIMDAVRRLPVPYWLTYLILFIVHSLIHLIISWLDGWISPFSIDPLLFTFPLWLWGTLAIMTYLDGIALEALSEFSPLLELDESGMQRLKFEFTTLPARPVLVNSITWSGVFFLLTYLAYDAFYVRLGVVEVLFS